MRMARYPAGASTGQPRRADARAVRLAPGTRAAAHALTTRAGPAPPDLTDARAARARTAFERRGLRGGGTGAIRADAPPSEATRGGVHRGRGASIPRLAASG